MKFLFWAFVFGAIGAAVTALTGFNSYRFGTSGASIGEASVGERILSVFLIPLFTYGAILVKKGGLQAWWVVTVLWLSSCIGFLSNVIYAFEEPIVFLIWGLITQIGLAALIFYYWFTYWLPKKGGFASKKQNQPVETTETAARPPRLT